MRPPLLPSASFSEHRRTPSPESASLRALLDGSADMLRGTNRRWINTSAPGAPTAEALRSRDALRHAVRALGLWLKLSGVSPEHLVPTLRSHFATRRAGDAAQVTASLDATIVTWGIDGYYGASVSGL